MSEIATPPKLYYHLYFQLFPAPEKISVTQDTSASKAAGNNELESGIHIEHKHSDWVPDKYSDLFQSLPGRGRSSSLQVSVENSGRLQQQPLLDDNTSTQYRVATKDWRFAHIVIDSLDLDMVPTHETRARVQLVDTDGEKVKRTEVGWGIVHLFRENEDSKDMPLSTSQEQDPTILCIPAVPSYMTPNDLLGWVGEKTLEHVSHVRLVMTGQMNRYLVLLKFRDAKSAHLWSKSSNGKLFGGMEPETCNIIPITSIVFNSSSPAASSASPLSFPELSQDPFGPPVPTPVQDPAESLALRPLPPPTHNLVELPSCPVCLDSLDSTASGLLTILCQHTFHCSCLRKWQGSGCPVCRHVQPSPYLNLARPFGSPDISHDFCSICDTQEDLWICLICGNVGCGRYKGGHAKEHWKDSAHCFALEIETQHVWDYGADSWVHRLIQSKGDAKLMEFPAAVSHANAVSRREDMVPRAKLDGMGAEYMHLLTSQLESQRMYFEDLVKKAVEKATSASAIAESLTVQHATITDQLEQFTAEQERLRSEIVGLEKERDRLKARAEKSAELARKMTGSYQEEKQVGQGLMARITHFESSITKLVDECTRLRLDKADLAEQNRDLGFFISSQEKLKAVGDELGEDIVEGTVSLPETKEPKGKKKGKGKGKAS